VGAIAIFVSAGRCGSTASPPVADTAAPQRAWVTRDRWGVYRNPVAPARDCSRVEDIVIARRCLPRAWWRHSPASDPSRGSRSADCRSSSATRSPECLRSVLAPNPAPIRQGWCPPHPPARQDPGGHLRRTAAAAPRLAPPAIHQRRCAPRGVNVLLTPLDLEGPSISRSQGVHATPLKGNLRPRPRCSPCFFREVTSMSRSLSSGDHESPWRIAVPRCELGVDRGRGDPTCLPRSMSRSPA